MYSYLNNFCIFIKITVAQCKEIRATALTMKSKVVWHLGRLTASNCDVKVGFYYYVIFVTYFLYSNVFYLNRDYDLLQSQGKLSSSAHTLI